VFLELPFRFATNLQQIVLVVNTVLLIVALIVMELVYSETPREKRVHLKNFLPLLLLLVALLIYAAYKQVGKN
jgi:predicted neutral ceramidase superfamily lipid hydrolase